MKLQRWIITVITGLFLLFFADAVLIEASWLHGNPISTFREQLMSAASASEETLNNHFHLRYIFYECAGLFNRCIGRRHVDGFYRLNNGQLVSVGGNGDVSDSVTGMVSFRDFCQENAIPLLYVNLPKKYVRNEDLTAFGVEDLTDLKADHFLTELSRHGIDTLDIRPFIETKYEDPYDAFFKTDHHWKISAGLYCAQILAKRLRDDYGIDLATEKIRNDAFSVTVLENSWLGERGKKTGSFYSGLDDFELFLPLTETHFQLEIPKRQIHSVGDFSIMIDRTRMESDFWKRRYGPSFYYAYLFQNDPVQIITNEDQRNGKILIIKDSFTQSVAPFLAMTANTVVTWDVRYNTDSLRDYIRQNQFDMIIVMYTETMINCFRRDRFMFDFT